MLNAELLREKIDGSGLKHGFIAQRLNLTKQGFSRKLKQGTEFRPSQIIILCDLLRLAPEEREQIFFASNVDK